VFRRVWIAHIAKNYGFARILLSIVAVIVALRELSDGKQPAMLQVRLEDNYHDTPIGAAWSNKPVPSQFLM